jgi:ubiquinone/menaquinone biosynthesis C-methylase UbiE
MEYQDSTRLRLQRKLATGKIVNIGCESDPAGFREVGATQVDIDHYDLPNFVQADAHNLPFKDDEFDTAVLGDILEHVVDPVQVLREAGRVAKKVVCTIFEEWRCPGFGQHVEVMVKKGRDDLKAMGFNTHMEYLKSLPEQSKTIVSIVDDDVTPHHFHINQFKDEDIPKMFEEAGLEVQIRTKSFESTCDGHDIFIWVIVATKKVQS